MTALNVFKTPDGVHLFTDGSITSMANGNLLFITTKVGILPHLSCVVSARNNPEMAAFVQIGIMAAHVSSFDSLALAFAGIVAEAQGKLTGSGYPPSAVEVVIAGMDASGAPRALVCYGRAEDWEAGYPVLEIDRIALPGAYGDFSDALAAMVDPYSPDFDPVRDGVALMQAQRDLTGGTAIGGFVQLTTVTLEGISTRILRRWADKIGDACRLGIAQT